MHRHLNPGNWPEPSRSSTNLLSAGCNSAFNDKVSLIRSKGSKHWLTARGDIFG